MATAATAALSFTSAFTKTTTTTTTSKNQTKPSTNSPSPLHSLTLTGLHLRGGPRHVILTAVARYGGGRPYCRGGSRRRQRTSGFVDPGYDPALDLDQLQSNSVRLLDQEQSMVGVMSLDEAVQMADDSELVLAILSPDADPPVLRLFDSEDYKKHKFEQQKKKRVQQKRSLANRVDIKEVKMGYNIDSHDYSVRLRAAKRFLSDGDKVKVIVNLKRRENAFKDKAIELLNQFQNDLGELANEESKNFSIRDIFMVLMPNKAVTQKAQEQPKKKEEQAKEVPAIV